MPVNLINFPSKFSMALNAVEPGFVLEPQKSTPNINKFINAYKNGLIYDEAKRRNLDNHIHEDDLPKFWGVWACIDQDQNIEIMTYSDKEGRLGLEMVPAFYHWDNGRQGFVTGMGNVALSKAAKCMQQFYNDDSTARELESTQKVTIETWSSHSWKVLDLQFN